MYRHRVSSLSWLTLHATVAIALLAVPRVLAHAELILQIEEQSKLISKEPGNIEHYFRRGELHRAHVDWAAALADFERILAIDPGNKEVDYSLGRLMADSGWLLSAKGYLDRFIASHPRHAEAYTTRARVQTRLNLHLGSADDYAAAIRLSPEPGPELFIERAQTLTSESSDYIGRAIEGLDDGIQRIGPLVTLQLIAIDLEVKRTNFAAALERVDSVTQRSPRKETWLTRRAEILEKAGRQEEARTTYEAALAALGTLPPVRRNVPAMAQLEKKIRGQIAAIDAARPQAAPRERQR